MVNRLPAKFNRDNSGKPRNVSLLILNKLIENKLIKNLFRNYLSKFNIHCVGGCNSPTIAQIQYLQSGRMKTIWKISYNIIRYIQFNQFWHIIKCIQINV